MSRAALLGAIQKRVKTDPIGAACEARDVAAEFYAQARSIEGTPEFKAAVQAAARDMAYRNRERKTSG